MKAMLMPSALVLALAACATNPMSDPDRLAIYQAHAGAPVKQIRNYDAISWDEIDGSHVALTMRPNEAWLLTLSGPCLDWGAGSPVLKLSGQGGWVMAKFDRVQVAGSPVTCRIEEIRPLDIKAVRAALAAQPSGT